MILGHGKIKIVDITEQQFHNLTVGNLWSKYDAKALAIPGGLMIDMIEHENVMIQDLYGWTRIHRIIRWDQMRDDARIYCVRFNDDQTGEVRSLYTDYNSLIPVWEYQNPDIGFHGMISYPYKLCNPDTLLDMEKQGWRMRIRNSEGEEFPACKYVLVEEKPTVLYQIWTQSGFYNVNGIQIFGMGQIPYSKIVVRKDFTIE